MIRVTCADELELTLSTDTYAQEYAPYIVGWISLLSCSPIGLKPRSVLTAFEKRLATDYGNTAKAMNAAAKSYLRVLSGDYIQNDPVLVTRFLRLARRTPVFKELRQSLINGNVQLITFCLSVLRFGAKTVSSADEAEFAAQAFRKWTEVEERLAALVLNCDDTAAMRFIMCTLFRSADMSNTIGPVNQTESGVDIVWFPAHGGGRVAEVGLANSLDKDENLVFPKRLFVALARTGDLSKILPERGVISIGTRQTARYKTVPKDITKVRVMCMEPCAVQWAQQSLRLVLEKVLRNGTFKRFCDLRDQSRNQIAALEASSHKGGVTLDLESASDSNSWELVETIFPTDIVKVLNQTRTSRVSTPEGVVDVHKYAPMGSATCFPVQSMVYICAALWAHHMVVYGKGQMPTVSSLDKVLKMISDDPYYVPSDTCDEEPRSFTTLCVYGDDIVCDCRVAETLIQLLTELGFKINRGKSFLGWERVRESCGIYAYNGKNITPFSFKPDSLEGIMTPTLLAALVDASNRAWDYGYSLLRLNMLYLAHYLSHRSGGSKFLKTPRPLLYGANAILGPRPDFAVRGKLKYNSTLKSTLYTFDETSGKLVRKPVTIPLNYGVHASNSLLSREWERVITISRLANETTDSDPISGLLGFYRQAYSRENEKQDDVSVFDAYPYAKTDGVREILDSTHLLKWEWRLA